VTRPTAAMRRAMAEAEVGDDFYEEDPTVRLLEQETAAVLGMEAALFTPTGCMGNEIAVAVQTLRGQSILLHRDSHLRLVEASAVSGVMGREYRVLEGDRGRLRAEDVTRALADGGKDGIALVEVENTQNWGSGAIYSLPMLEAIAVAARARGIPLHLDGARIWNASAATGVPPASYAAVADTVMVCFSKGLGAPVGSALAGSADMVREARGIRKTFGGGMRQVGIIAAGALHGMRHHRERLVDDHRRARAYAEAIADIPGIRLDPATIESNIVIAEIDPPHERVEAFAKAVCEQGVLITAFGGPGRFRAVTHLDVDDAGIERAIAAVRKAARSVLVAA